MGATLGRRRFVQQGAAAAAVAAVPAVRAAGGPAAAERLRVGLIGCGGRMRQMLEFMRHWEDVDYPVVCDVYEDRMERTAEVLAAAGPPRPGPERTIDYRRLLDRRDVDAVWISTTEHWHGLPTIHAAQAGKDIFVEKPLSYSVAEGRAMVQAVEQGGVVAMMGTQQRAGSHYQRARELVRSGRLGKVALVECWNYHNTRGRVGRAADGEPPAGLHWDRWLGPAPAVPFNPARLASSWWFDYSGGMLTNWAVHHVDIILWVMGEDAPTQVGCLGGKLVVDDLADTPDTIEASWRFSDWVMQYRYRGFNNFHAVFPRPNHHGIAFHGNEATLVLDRYGFSLWEDRGMGEPVERATCNPYYREGGPPGELDGPWQRLFVDCVKQGRRPPLALEESHRATVCCQLANIAYRTGRSLHWVGEKETIRGDAEAAALLAPPRRAGFELPAV